MSVSGVAAARSNSRSNSKVPELDGVRGIAILLVLLYHFQGNRPKLIPAILGAPLTFGWSGVDLFFVLSGFLITGILLDTREAKNYFSSFYARRVLRIFPLYLLAVFLCFHVGLPLLEHYAGWNAPDPSLEKWYWIHLSNWKSAFAEDVYLLTHFWSLSIEEQFYLIWPLIVLVAARKPRRLALVCWFMFFAALGLRCAFAKNTFGVGFLGRLTPFRLDSLAIGAYAAIVIRDREWLAATLKRLPFIAAASSALLIGVILAERRFKPSVPLTNVFGFSLFACFWACFVLWAYVNSGYPTWLAVQLRRPSLRNFGKYSYGIYVLHWPICTFELRFLDRWWPSPGGWWSIPIWISSIAFGIGLSYCVALISWHAMEKHALRLKYRFAAQYDAGQEPPLRASSHAHPLSETSQ